VYLLDWKIFLSSLESYKTVMYLPDVNMLVSLLMTLRRDQQEWIIV